MNWFPGYYLLTSTGASDANKVTMINDPVATNFTGYQLRYLWEDCELTQDNYAAGYSLVDTDLARVAAKGKKLLVMLQTKTFDGSFATPAYIRQPGSAYCSASGTYCGEFVVGDTHMTMLWNSAVAARCQKWVAAMVGHVAAGPYADLVGAIVFTETATPTTDTVLLADADYDPYDYIAGLQGNLGTVVDTTERFPAFYYHEGGFVDMGGGFVGAVTLMGDWMLAHPHTGTGTPDSQPLNPKTSNHPCANASYQGKVPCNPDVQAPDYATVNTTSLDDTFTYMTDPIPDGLLGSYLSFSYAVGAGPNAFTLSDVASYIPTHPVPNTVVPPGW